jgi:DNA repair ATPase RecN
MRRQVLLSVLFTVLLLVPLGLAGFYFVFGRTDRQVVQEEVERRVEPVEKMARDAQPALAEIQTTTAAVRAQQAAVQDQQQRVDALVQDQENVRTQVTQLSEQVPRLEASLVEAREIGDRVTDIRATLDAQGRRLGEVAEAQAKIARDQERINGDVRVLSDRVNRFPLERLEQLDRRFDQLSGQVNSLVKATRVPRERTDVPPHQ